MKNYLIEKDNRVFVKSVSGYVPKNSIGVVPNFISKEDFPYVTYREVPHEFIPDTMIKEIYLDEDAKALGDAALAAEVEEKVWTELRRKRDTLLKDSDFSQLQDAPLTAQQVTDWQVYRQALRDFPENVVDVYNPIWPTKPE